jgi:hypothetical protein
MSKLEIIPIQKLLIDLQNPRYDPRTNQHEAILTIINEQGSKLIALADDIVKQGSLNPSELPMVIPSGDKSTYIVIEGNRRLTALKLMLSPSLLQRLNLADGTTKKYKLLHEKVKDTMSQDIPCSVFQSREEARHWIDLRHTGENGGVGIVPWDGIQTQRFRGSSPSLQAIEAVRNSGYIDEDTHSKLPKIAITNVERVLNTPEAREILGVDIKNNGLIFIEPDEVVIPRLAKIVSDIANKKKRVTQLDSKEQRIDYAREVIENPIQKPKKSEPTVHDSNGVVTSNAGISGPQQRALPVNRKTLIPRRLKLRIPIIRLNRIYDELQRLDVGAFSNSCAVLLRVFVELSVDEYAQNHDISTIKVNPSRVNAQGESIPEYVKEISLREKLIAVATSMEKEKLCRKDELRGVRTIVNNREHVLSVESLHAYVHNRNYNPLDTDLKITWDNLESFIKRIWST